MSKHSDSDAADSNASASNGLSTTAASPFVDEDAAWDFLGELLEEFSRRWRTAPPEPALEEFVNKVNESGLPGFRALALIELIKVELEIRIGIDPDSVSVQQYVDRWPELKQNGELPPDLVYEELRLKKLSASPDQTTAPGGPESTAGEAAIGKLVRMIDPEMTRTTSIHASARAHRFQPGETVDDFDLLARLGRGAFASVFLARQNSMQRLVALKISADQGVEGQTLAQLDHPHIVRVYDQRVTGSPPVRLMYMQYIPGGSLSQVIGKMDDKSGERIGSGFVTALNSIMDDSGEPVPVRSGNREWLMESGWDQIVGRIGSQLADALEYSHQHGVLHRDIKPANILVDAHGYPKLVDFNISFSSGVQGTTAATHFGGSLAYMSPEQLECCHHEHDRQPDSLDEKSDIYSLGILLFELLTGVRPLQADLMETGHNEFMNTMIDVRRRNLTETERNLLEENLKQSDNRLLAGAITRSLEPDKEKRFVDASAFSRQLGFSSDGVISGYLNGATTGWRKLVAAYPFLAVILTGLIIAIFATEFVTVFNTEQAIAVSDEPTFYRIRQRINIVLFPAVMFLAAYLLRPVIRAMNPVGGDGTIRQRDPDALQAAVDRNFNLAHYLGLAFVVVWSLAGIAYPLLLALAGAKVTPTTWLDFVFSHLVGGLITGAYVFCTVTVYSLLAIHPQLVLSSLNLGCNIETGQGTETILKRNTFYQFLAVASPLAAIAMLVLLRRDINTTFAVGGLAVGALLGLVVLRWSASHIEKTAAIIRSIG